MKFPHPAPPTDHNREKVSAFLTHDDYTFLKHLTLGRGAIDAVLSILAHEFCALGRARGIQAFSDVEDIEQLINDTVAGIRGAVSRSTDLSASGSLSIRDVTGGATGLCRALERIEKESADAGGTDQKG